MPATETPYRVFGTLRCGLAFLVFLSHSQFLWSALASSGLLFPCLADAAVRTFYVLSGFVIAEAAVIFYGGKPFSFLANRFLRLIPPYLGALALSILIHAYLASSGLWLTDRVSVASQGTVPASADILSSGTILFNLSFPVPILVSQVLRTVEDQVPVSRYLFVRTASTLQVEFVFYYFVFGCLLLMAWTGRYQRWIAGMATAMTVVGAVVAEHLWGVTSAFSFAPYFLLGAGFYLREHWERWAGHLLVGVAAVLVCWQFTREHSGTLEGAWLAGTAAILAVFLGAIPLLAPLRPSRTTRKADRWFGDLSYPLYLCHYPVLLLLAALVPGRNAAVWLMAVAGACAVSWAMMQLIQKPLQMMRDRVRGNRLDRSDPVGLDDPALSPAKH